MVTIDSSSIWKYLQATGLDPVHEEKKPEPDVEHVARLFMKVVMNAIMVAASLAKGSSPGQWGISHRIGSVYLAALSLRERATARPLQTMQGRKLIRLWR